MFSRCSLACRDHYVLSSMQMIFSAFIGVDVMVTGTVGDSVVLFRMGDGGYDRFGISVVWACGLGIWILNLDFGWEFGFGIWTKEFICVVDGLFIPRITSVVSVVYVNASRF